MTVRPRFLLLAVSCIAALGTHYAAAQAQNLQNLTLVVDQSHPLRAKAAQFLQQEIARRGGMQPSITSATPAGSRASLIFMDTVAAPLADTGDLPDRLQVPDAPEAFAMWSRAGRIMLRGADERGLLFAAGRLIQELSYEDEAVNLAKPLRIASAPRYAIRAHQLGYRNTANTYDLWDVATFDHYIRDLIIFGTNGIELIPALQPGEMDSPVMKENMWDMTLALCDTISSYGIDVWMWSAVDEDLSKPEEYKTALEKRRLLFESCSRIDHFFVPGGDDGENLAQYLMPWLVDLAAILKETQPHAKLWVSNQTFTDEENAYFFDFLESGKAPWLEGVVYGPWTHMTLEEMRAKTPSQFKMRRYPDINHNVRCQYPIYDWDPALAHTLNRESVDPRPHAMTHIHNLFARHADGFGTYSDGIHDDLNKVFWSLLGWDPERTVEEMTASYAKVFFRDSNAELAAKALLGLEDNWRGPVLENTSIPKTLQQWRELWKALATEQETNWRLQMYLYRAYFDAYTQDKARQEKAQEGEANSILASAGTLGAEAAMDQAMKLLGGTEGPAFSASALEYRREMERMAPMMLRSIGYQLSVKPPYMARNAERGAMLDTLDQPLNNRLWLADQFAQIRELPEEADRVRRLHALATWESPSKGSFYDNLGDLTQQAHLVRQKTWEEDPGGVSSSMVEFPMAMNTLTLEFKRERLSWLSQAQTLYGTPLQMHYKDLDPDAEYRVRVTYAGRFGATMRLTADAEHEIHGPLKQPSPIAPVEFDVPKAATADGDLLLSWELVEGRGCQVAEVWLLKSE